jgi:hypothetical protein
MIPELEVLDQLQGSDMTVDRIARLFPDLDRCRRAIGFMLRDREIELFDAELNLVPLARYRKLQYAPEFWTGGTTYRLRITDLGAKRA